MSGLYLLDFFEFVVVGNLSWQYVNIVNHMIYGVEGLSGG
jgi:hypothetical protein